ncbi:flavin reductase [Micromonospora musae]|uniref:Flavin reductase n=1 Tax=Micromonospora musae TaxID=1894970 RepID=A0ABX9QWJ9_9ACTN|nr:flavin reductase [Micromonospora musae]RKN14935.1 flavin reductase [Micromonospora musae]
MSVHQPGRPQWICARCGVPWPCRTRKRQLVAEFTGARISLMLHLSADLLQACEDLPHTPSGVLHARFLAWPRSAALHTEPPHT